MEKLKCYVLLNEQQKSNLSKEFNLTFGLLLKDACKKRGITYRELAFLSGIDPSNITRIVKGKYSTSIRIFSRLMYCLGYIHVVFKDSDL